MRFNPENAVGESSIAPSALPPLVNSGVQLRHAGSGPAPRGKALTNSGTTPMHAASDRYTRVLRETIPHLNQLSDWRHLG